MKQLVLAALISSLLAFSQTKIVNSDFETGEVGAVPPGWFVPARLLNAGFTAKLVDQGCRTSHCAMITGIANPSESMFGNLMQNLSAGGLTSRRLRLRAAIRVEGANTNARMWIRLDRGDNSVAFLDNMEGRAVTSSEWKTYDTEVKVRADVSRIALGFMLFGPGKAWIDDVSLEVLDEIRKDAVEPPRPITAQGMANLTAFARLYGYVRFFHPSDEAAQADWEAIAIDGVRAVESAGSDAQLMDRLVKIFQPVAPSIQLYGPSAIVLRERVSGTKFTRYRHEGVGLQTSTLTQFSPYHSTREQALVTLAASFPKPFEADLIPGVHLEMPVALYLDSKGATLPHGSAPGPSVFYERSADDRATRLAGVIIAWNVFQHFHPYLDVMKIDWMGELPKALRSAASEVDFQKTLQHLIVGLKDGHGWVSSPSQKRALQAPLKLDWVQDQLLVTRVRPGVELTPGDRVLKIDGKPVEQAASEARALISGATDQWVRYQMAESLARCDSSTNRISFEVEPYTKRNTSKAVELACVQPKFKDPDSYPEARPAEKIKELEPGIFYVDLDRVNDAEFANAIADLQKAKGIIFDMRGYPAGPGIQSLAHLTDNEIRSAKWNVGSAALPDRLDTTYNESGWPVAPQKPYFNAKRVFLTDGRAISYAETVMGIVEAYKLGEIVGGPTAGTNGNINPFRLPGGYSVSWTGMKVLKHDGSQHHGIGILPTVPAARTRQGVAEGKDEVLLKGLEVVKSGSAP